MGVARNRNGCPCPLCKATSTLLKGNTMKRFFCIECGIEFTTDGKYRIKKVYELTSGGDTVEILDWKK